VAAQIRARCGGAGREARRLDGWHRYIEQSAFESAFSQGKSIRTVSQIIRTEASRRWPQIVGIAAGTRSKEESEDGKKGVAVQLQENIAFKRVITFEYSTAMPL
jgi:hypothetical protein